MRKCLATAFVTMLAMSISVWAADDEHGHDAHADGDAHHVEHHEVAGPHPTLPDPQHTTWAGAMVIIIIGMFVAAAAVGMVVRANAPDEAPEADSHHHDDAHGDHGHGHGHGHDSHGHGGH